MKTKVLVVPVLIIVSGFVALNYIKPDFDVYKQKRLERDAAKEHAAQAASTAQNVTALTGELETQKEKITLVKRYLPAEKDEARMFDSFNFLTSQAGLITSRIQIQKVEDEEESSTGASPTFATNIDPIAAAQPAGMPGAIPPSGGAALPGITAPVSQYKAPTVKKYSVSLEALGGYGNIKELVKKLEGFDRLQEIQGFKISNSESANADTESGGAGTLTLTYSAILPFQETPAPASGEAIVNIPGLKQGTFNFSEIERIQTAITNTVPDNVLGTEGKANPFE